MAQSILITGCSSGIGRATALEFAKRGWNVVATMRRIGDAGDLTTWENIHIAALDVRNAATIGTAIEAGVERFGRIDTVLNNAGFAINTVFESVPPEKVRDLFDVNLFGVMNVTRAILPHFRSVGRGMIVNVSSGAGVFALPLASLYNASKFAVEGFSEALSYELASIGVRVKIVEPGAAPTTGFPKRSIGEAAAFDIPDAYRPYVAEAQEVYQRFRNDAPADALDTIARGIFEATADESDRLRYVLTGDIKPLIAARREKSEEAYMATMRSTFPFKLRDPAQSNG